MPRKTDSKPSLAFDNAPSGSAIVPGTRTWVLYLVWLLGCVALFQGPLRSLFDVAAHNDSASHIFLIPLITGYLLRDLSLFWGELPRKTHGLPGPFCCLRCRFQMYCWIAL